MTLPTKVLAKIDCSDIELQQIRTPTLRPLRYITKYTNTRIQPSDDQFQALVPTIGLYLSNNDLTEVPGEIYHLQNLTVLSLRSNSITEILPSIANLSNLRELNLGGNQLRYLPYELVSLRGTIARKNSGAPKFTVFPNPLMRPVPSDWAWDREIQQVDHVYFASTRIAFLDILGNSLRNGPPAPSSTTGSSILLFQFPLLLERVGIDKPH